MHRNLHQFCFLKMMPTVKQRFTDLLKDNHWEEVMSIINVLYQTKRSKRWYAICMPSNHLNGSQNSQKYWVNSGNLYAGADLDRNVRPSVGRKATIELFEAASNFSSVEFKPSTMPEQERRSHGFEVFEFAFLYCCVLNRCVFITCRWSWRRRERKDVPSLLLNPRVGKWPVWRKDSRSTPLFVWCCHVFASAAHSL